MDHKGSTFEKEVHRTQSFNLWKRSSNKGSYANVKPNKMKFVVKCRNVQENENGNKEKKQRQEQNMTTNEGR